MSNVITERWNESREVSMRCNLITDLYKITYAYHHKGAAKLSKAQLRISRRRRQGKWLHSYVLMSDDSTDNVKITTQWRRSRGGSGGTCPPKFLRVGATPPQLSTCTLTLNRLGGLSRSPLVFFRNNSWTLSDIDMKLGMTLWTSFLRRLVKEKSNSGKKHLRYSRFCDVTSREKDKCLKIRPKYVCEAKCKKPTKKIVGTWTSLRDGCLEFLKFWVFDLQNFKKTYFFFEKVPCFSYKIQNFANFKKKQNIC